MTATTAEVRRLKARVRQLEEALSGNRKRLTPKEVQQIRDMYRAGHSNPQLAEVFDVNRSTIYRITKGHSYR